MARYVQRGETIDFINNTSAVIEAGDVVTLGTRIGIAATDIPVGVTGTINIIGVFDIPADNTAAFTVGQAVYFKDGKLTGTDTGAIYAGWVVEPKATAATKARIKIG